MNLYQAIAEGVEFAKRGMPGRAPLTVLIAPEGVAPSAVARGIRDALAGRMGVDLFDMDAGTEERTGDALARAVVSGPLLQAAGQALRFPGSFAVVPACDPGEAAAALRRASNGAPGVHPKISLAVRNTQAIVPLGEGPDGPVILPGGVLAVDGLSGEVSGYVPGEATASANAPEPVRAAPEPPPPPPEPVVEPLDVDLDRVAAELEKGRLTAYLMDWREVAPDDSDPGLGGTTPANFIPEGTEWPRDDEGTPFASVLYLDVARMPPPARDLLGGSGHFQLFVSLDGEMPTNEGGWLARVVDPTGPGAWTDMPDDEVADQKVERRTVTAWREVREVAYCNEDRQAGLAAVDPEEAGFDRDHARAIDALQSSWTFEDRLPPEGVAEAVRRHALDPAKAEHVAGLLAHHRRDKLLGWPSWEQWADWQDDGEPGSMALLLQLSFDARDAIAPSLIAGDGSLQVLVSTDGKRRFAFSWNCG